MVCFASTAACGGAEDGAPAREGMAGAPASGGTGGGVSSSGGADASPGTGGQSTGGQSSGGQGSGGDDGSGGENGSGGDTGSGGKDGSGGAPFEPWLYPERGDDAVDQELAARALYTSTPIALRGQVVSSDGSALAGAIVTVRGSSTITDASGTFELTQLPRKNSALTVTGTGHRELLAHVHLARPVSVSDVLLDPLVATPTHPATTRLLFGGDVAFGRRYLDPTDSTPSNEVPPPNPSAWIDTSDPFPGTQEVMRHVRQLFLNSDFRSVNLETPVTSNPATPHPSKDYVFFTLPGSLGVFPWLGVEYVALGNNHVFDYLDAGLADTLSALDAAGLAHSGAGATPTAAFAPHRRTLAGHPYSFLSMTSITGSHNPPLYVATADPLEGGAADLTDTSAVTQSIADEVALGRHPIVQLHTGIEYSYAPSDYARGRMELAADAGAALVVAHHPHMAQGFAHQNGVLLVQSLGNLAFDQARLETMLGLLAVIDLEGATVSRARGVPIFLEEFSPKPIVGSLADGLVRRIAEVSRSEHTAVITHHHEAWVEPDSAAFDVTSRAVDVSVEIPLDGFAVLDLRRHELEGESLASASTTSAGVVVRTGQDLWLHGDFEDGDVDDDVFEANQWELAGASRYVCLDQPFAGAAALCSLRRSTNTSSSVTTFRNRVRLFGDKTASPNKDVTLFGYARGDGAGAVTVTVRYMASEGATEFGNEVAYADPGGTFSWRPFAADLSVPADLVDPVGDLNATHNPRALWLTLSHAPPAAGTGLSRFDELALVSWLDSADLNTGIALATPHPRQFLRIEAPPGTYTVRLTFERHRPAL